MITQSKAIRQAISERVVAEIPIVQGASGDSIYILVKDLPEETTKFIQGESFVGMEVPVLPDDYEKMVVAGWRSRGYKCTYCRQSMEYMKRNVIVRYLHVINPETEVSIFLIPWFMLPQKKYPVQVYAYASWYSAAAEEPVGVRETAEVVRGLFGLETFDPSTVCRTKAQMSHIFRQMGENEGALSNEEPEIATSAAIVEWVTEALEKQLPAEFTKYIDGMKAARIDTHPIPATMEAGGQTNEAPKCSVQVTNNGNNEGNSDIELSRRTVRCTSEDSVIARILGNIPRECRKVTIPKPRAKHERRDRLPRERGERLPAKRKEIDFAPSRQLETSRDEFIRNCMNIVFNAALIYHKLLI